jgi:hypothetical protein
VLANEGRIEEAVSWLRRALNTGNLNFLRVSRDHLLASPHPEIRLMALHYYQRAARTGDSLDVAQYQQLMKRFETSA